MPTSRLDQSQNREPGRQFPAQDIICNEGDASVSLANRARRLHLCARSHAQSNALYPTLHRRLLPSLLVHADPARGDHPRSGFMRYSPLVIIQLVIIGRHMSAILIPCVYEVTPIRPRTSWRCADDYCRRTRSRRTVMQICPDVQVRHRALLIHIDSDIIPP